MALMDASVAAEIPQQSVVTAVIYAQSLVALRRHSIVALLISEQAFHLLARFDSQPVGTLQTRIELIDVAIVQNPEVPLSVSHGKT
jgi:hypothetical protein